MEMNMEKRVMLETGSDRISDLPEPIRKHIVSFLPTTRDAVRIGILSNSWKGLWVDVPHLLLSKYDLSGLQCSQYLYERDSDDDDDAVRARRESILRKRENFYGFLDNALRTMNVVEKLVLFVPGFGLELKSRVDSWVDHAVGCQLKVLELEIGSVKDAKYVLPKSIFGVNLIMKLKLENCEINESCLSGTELPYLHVLYIDSVQLSEEVMESLLLNCPNLKEFTFKNCHGVERLEVLGLTKLEKVEVWHYDSELDGIKIEAPNLIEFAYECEDYSSDGYCAIDVAACKNMKCLSLANASLDDDELKDILESLQVLEKLRLYHCNFLHHVEISCPQLDYLDFTWCRDLMKAKMAAPNLKFFNYEDCSAISLIFKGKAPKLTRTRVFLKPITQRNKWYADLVKFLAKLGHSDHVILNVDLEETLIIPDKVRMKFSPPLHGVKHLTVDLRASFLKRTPVKLMKALMWLAPCPVSISVHNDYVPVYKLLEFTYETPLKCKSCGCWKKPPIICWRHSLKKVSIENKKGAEDETKLVNFFHKGRIDGNIECSVKNSRPVPKRVEGAFDFLFYLDHSSDSED